jgi:hypothetical protein
LEKQVKKNKEKQSMKTKCNQPIEEREKGGQQDSPMVRGVQLYQRAGKSTNRRWSTEGSTDREKEGVNQGHTPKRKARRRQVNPRLAMGQSQF